MSTDYVIKRTAKGVKCGKSNLEQMQRIEELLKNIDIQYIREIDELLSIMLKGPAKDKYYNKGHEVSSLDYVEGVAKHYVEASIRNEETQKEIAKMKYGHWLFGMFK